MVKHLIFSSWAMVKPEPGCSVPGTILGHFANKGCSASHAYLVNCLSPGLEVFHRGSPVSSWFAVFVWTSSKVEWMAYLGWFLWSRFSLELLGVLLSKCDALIYRPLKARTNIKMFLIKCSGPRFFGSLPVTLVNMPHINQFKTALKRYLAAWYAKYLLCEWWALIDIRWLNRCILSFLSFRHFQTGWVGIIVKFCVMFWIMFWTELLWMKCVNQCNVWYINMCVIQIKTAHTACM